MCPCHLINVCGKKEGRASKRKEKRKHEKKEGEADIGSHCNLEMGRFQ